MSDSPTPHLLDLDVATLDRVFGLLDPMFPPATVGTSAVQSNLPAEIVLRDLIYAAGQRSVIDKLDDARRAKRRE